MPIIWHHVHCVNYHRGMWTIIPNLVPVSFCDLGNISGTIEGSCFISCVLTYYRKAARLAKGQGKRSMSRSRRSQNSQNLKTAISSPFFLARHPDFACSYADVMLIIWHHIHYVNCHRGVRTTMPNLVQISFCDLGSISWTIEGSCFISCVLTYYCKAA